MPDTEQNIDGQPSGMQLLEARFHQLADRWRQQAEFFSSDTEIALLPEYQSIIGMGPAVVPLILRELRVRSDHWFWALRAITGEDPTPPASRGRMEEMRRAWIAWGEGKGYL